MCAQSASLTKLHVLYGVWQMDSFALPEGRADGTRTQFGRANQRSILEREILYGVAHRKWIVTLQEP